MISSYRLQLNSDFPFSAAVGVLDHLARIGISHVYTSPILEAIPGSTHFYDGVNPNAVSDELGGEAGLEHLVAELRKRNMKLIVDHVPNHLSVAQPVANRWWWDVLSNGPESAFATFFDIDWDAGNGRVVLPMLGEPLPELERRGDLQRRTVNGAEVLDLFGLQLPGGAAEQRHYQLDHWKAGTRNYRVFFDINELAAVRMEDPAVFAAATAKLSDLIQRDLIDGLRLDHIDGLADPAGSLHRFREMLGPQRLLLVEKITIGDEELPASWPVDGATGYDFAADVLRLLTAPSGVGPLMEVGRSRTGLDSDITFATLEHAAKYEAMRGGLAPGVKQLARLAGVSAATIEESIAPLTVYRTYLTGDHQDPLEQQRLRVAFDTARSNGRAPTGEVDELEEAVLSNPGSEVARRFQQLSAPVMAKGSEDTAMYRFPLLLAVSEVGADPDETVISIERFHERQQKRLTNFPGAMLTTSTHDTKRSEDVRARLAALTESPAAWDQVLQEVDLPDVESANGTGASIHPQDRYVFWQTVVGIWPERSDADLAPRLKAYMTKALREAKQRSSWTDTNTVYEAAMDSYIDQFLTDPERVGMIDAFVGGQLRDQGRRNSLIQTALRCLAPGFGDLYRGCETWDLSLVDPDNRRPLDWDYLKNLSVEAATGLAANEGQKLQLIQQCLTLRAAHEAAFAAGSTYVPIECGERILGFTRGDPEACVAVIVALPGADPAGDLGAVKLPVLERDSGSWKDLPRVAHSAVRLSQRSQENGDASDI